MTITLDRLPFDILFHIASSLNLDDIIHLGYTCLQLKALLHESTLCRKAIETHAAHSKEARLAQDQKITYSEALKSIYDRRTAFSHANPFSSRVVGQGIAFTYRQGILCILDGNTIRVSDEHASSSSHEINLSPIISSIAEPFASSSCEIRISLLYYSDEVLAVHYEQKGRPSNGRIFAITTKFGVSEREKVIKEIQLESSYKIFVRHTSSFLYYGTYTGTGNHGHHEWEIRGASLDPSSPLPPCPRPLQLEEFFGTDIGSTIAFQIHDGYFYAVSNQTTFDAEELDWTSFYHCVRFPLQLPLKKALEVNPWVYRRQHKEGPIHDSWTDLAIQADECTNKPLIVESRREWQNGSSKQLRTFYISNFEFKTGKEAATPNAAPLLPEDDLLTGLVDSSNRPNYAPPKARYTWESHPEFPPGSENSSRSFLLARTKFRAYNLACSSFLDLVEDEKCCSDPATGPCLRIRIGSRRIAPIEWVSSCHSTVIRKANASLAVVNDDTAYRHSHIKMWPPPASKCPCSHRLHSILNPRLPSRDERNRVVTGVVDERSLVYMVRAAKPYNAAKETDKGVIVLVSFASDIARGQETRNYDVMDAANEKMYDWDATQDVVEKRWRWTRACGKGQCR